MNVGSLDRRDCALQIGVSVSRIRLLVLTFYAFSQTLVLPQAKVNDIATARNFGQIMRIMKYLNCVCCFITARYSI